MGHPTGKIVTTVGRDTSSLGPSRQSVLGRASGRRGGGEPARAISQMANVSSNNPPGMAAAIPAPDAEQFQQVPNSEAGIAEEAPAG